MHFLDELVDNGAGWSFFERAFIDNGGRIIGEGVYQDHARIYKLVPL